MKKLAYSPDYKDKIVQLRRRLDYYFGTEVRKKILKKIDKRIHMLTRFESMVISVRDVYGVECEYYCIYVAKNYVFYRFDAETVYILNIYNEREDFMQKMFGLKPIFAEEDE